MKAALVCFSLTILAANSTAQITPETIQSVQNSIGARIETVMVLGGDYAAAGGDYTFRGGSKADLAVTKLGGGGELSSHALGETGLKWAPYILGNVGFTHSQNELGIGSLQGNAVNNDAMAAQLGAGLSFIFNDHFSISPLVSGIYGHVENEFEVRNAPGLAFKQAAAGTLVDWELDTWSIVPAAEAKYHWLWRRTIVELSTHFSYFHTESFGSSSVLVEVDGDSETLENKIDLDVPIGLKLFDRELHTGGYFSRTEMFGGVSDGLHEDHLYTANGRLVLDLLGEVWKVRWIGLGASWIWGDHFDGWSVGVDFRFKF